MTVNDLPPVPDQNARLFARGDLAADTVKVVKTVRFRYSPTSSTTELLEAFRAMVNDAVQICLQENIRGRFSLRDRIYAEFKIKYEVVSVFAYSVAEVAWSIVKKHRRWQRMPFASRLIMKMDSSKYSLNHGIISLPFRKGERLLIPLDYGDYQRSFLVDETLRRGSVTMTDREIIIAFSKGTEPIESSRKVG